MSPVESNRELILIALFEHPLRVGWLSGVMVFARVDGSRRRAATRAAWPPVSTSIMWQSLTRGRRVSIRRG